MCGPGERKVCFGQCGVIVPRGTPPWPAGIRPCHLEPCDRETPLVCAVNEVCAPAPNAPGLGAEYGNCVAASPQAACDARAARGSEGNRCFGEAFCRPRNLRCGLAVTGQPNAGLCVPYRFDGDTCDGDYEDVTSGTSTVCSPCMDGLTCWNGRCRRPCGPPAQSGYVGGEGICPAEATNRGPYDCRLNGPVAPETGLARLCTACLPRGATCLQPNGTPVERPDGPLPLTVSERVINAGLFSTTVTVVNGPPNGGATSPCCDSGNGTPDSCVNGTCCGGPGAYCTRREQCCLGGEDFTRGVVTCCGAAEQTASERAACARVGAGDLQCAILRCGERGQPCCRDDSQSGSTLLHCRSGLQCRIEGNDATCQLDDCNPDRINASCCLGRFCSEVGVCVARTNGPTCVPCGGPGQDCCEDQQCDDRLRCANDQLLTSTCVDCGSPGLPCCTQGEACRLSTCNATTAQCDACGAPGQPCCPGTVRCGANAVCDAGNVCRACGQGSGQPCCTRFGEAPCGTGLICDQSASVCRPCGFYRSACCNSMGRPPCEQGLTCGYGSNPVLGICSCGDRGEVCCPPGNPYVMGGGPCGTAESEDPSTECRGGRCLPRQ